MGASKKRIQLNEVIRKEFTFNTIVAYPRGWGIDVRDKAKGHFMPYSKNERSGLLNSLVCPDAIDAEIPEKHHANGKSFG
jgi:hypothetical protein